MGPAKLALFNKKTKYSQSTLTTLTNSKIILYNTIFKYFWQAKMCEIIASETGKDLSIFWPRMYK